MNPDAIISSLERFGRVLPVLVVGVPDDDARWKPESGAWSILEIVTHLCDEEVEDFRMRVRLTLEEPEKDWPAIDPEGWAVARKYNEGDLRASVERFVAEREKSIAWLKELPGSGADWSRAHTHPKYGPFAAGALLASWAAHDLLHLRQITRRLYQLTQRDAGEHDIGYAGQWTA